MPACPGAEAAGEADSRFRLTPDPSGEGYVLTGTPLWLAGDATVRVTVPEASHATAELDDASLLLRYEVTPRLSLFTEVTLENTLRLEESLGLQTGSNDLSIERLYADWILTPQLTVRVGKFLTPFGLWNVIRRAPLTWTVERPLITQVFPEHTTGLSLIYQTTWHGWGLDATAYGPAQDELALRRSEESNAALAGGRIAAAHALGPAYASVGVNAAAFEDHQSQRWADIYGADLDVILARNQITGEFGYSHLRQPGAPHEWGLYLQDAVPLYGQLFGVFRLEHFAPRQGNAVNGQMLGLYWRPLPHLIIKADYQFTDRRSDDLERGFLATVSIFF